MFYWSFTSLVHFWPSTFFHPRRYAIARSLPSKDVCPSQAGILCLMVNHILKLFWPSGIHVDSFFTPAPVPNSKGNPVSGGAKYTGVRNFCNFRLKSPSISETVRDIGPWLLRNVIRNHRWRIDTCWFWWPCDLWPRFQGHDMLFDIEYRRNDMRWSHSYYRTSVGSRMRSIEWWHFQWSWRIPNPQKLCILQTSFYRAQIGNRTRSIEFEWYHFQWPWMTLTWISRSWHFWSRISEKWRVLKRKLSYYFTLIGNIPNIWNGTMFGDLDWPLNASRRFVSISWSSC